LAQATYSQVLEQAPAQERHSCRTCPSPWELVHGLILELTVRVLHLRIAGLKSYQRNQPLCRCASFVDFHRSCKHVLRCSVSDYLMVLSYISIDQKSIFSLLIE
jgi:hypothetical protein